MPKKFADDPTPEEQAPSKFGSLRNWLAGGTRMLSGVASGEGGFLGAGLSGGGESLAEWIEGSPQNPARIALESGIGAIPMASWFKVGKPIATAIKSGALSGVGEAGRELTKGEKLNPTQIATSTAIGGLTGGALSKFLGMINPKVANVVEKEAEVVPTAQTGQGTGVLKPGKPGKQSGRVSDAAPKTQYDTGTPTRKSIEIPYKYTPKEPPATIPTDLTTEVQGVPYASQGPEPYRASARAAVSAEEKAAAKAAKEAKETADAVEIAKRREETGLVNPKFSSSSTISAPGERFTTTYTKPSEEEADIAEALARGEGGPKSPVEPPPERAVQNPATAPEVGQAEPPPITPPETPLGKLLKPRKSRASKKTAEGFQAQVDKTLEDVNTKLGPQEAPPQSEFSVAQAKAARAAERARINADRFQQGLGPLPEEGGTIVPPASTVSQPESPVGALRKALEPGEQFVNPDLKVPGTIIKGREGATGLNKRMALGTSGEAAARDAHLIEQGKLPEGPLKGADPDWIQRELDYLKSQGGEINPSLLHALTGLTGAAIGAPIGAANSNEDDRLQGALTGGLIGGGLGIAGPSIIQAFQHPEGVVEGISQLGKKLPAIQRANLLTSTHGLPANAVAGPYGSAVMGSIEHALSGDPRGQEALKHLNPVDFLRKLPANFEEARGLIGRAEGTSLNAAATPMDKVLAVPGTTMTAGDLTARKALETGGGFLPEETREITMTNEPWTKSAHRLAELSKGSPLLQMLFPFSRTTANIAEQGAKRLPGVGFFVDRAMEQAGRAPDTLRTKLVQQAMGTGVMGGAGVLGANIDDPETSKIVQKYLTNAAGQYSLPASIGYSAGQAYNKGRNIFQGGSKELADALPLPTARPLQDIFNAGSDLIGVAQDTKDLNQVRMPHSLYPRAFADIDLESLRSLFTPSKPTTKKFID